MKNKINKYKALIPILFSFVISFMIFVSCSNDCPIKPSDPIIKSDCRTQTLTEFIPDLRPDTIPNWNSTADSIIFIPIPEYAIEYFEFPGLFYNEDSRYAEKVFVNFQKIIIASKLIDENNRAAVLDRYPLNADIFGDIMVQSVDVGGQRANLRFYGSLNIFSASLLTESCIEFYTYLNDHKNEFSSLSAGAKRYGDTVPNIISTRTLFLPQDAFVVNNDGKSGTGSTSNYLGDLLTMVNVTKAAVYVTVKPGDVYYYIARNGKSYAIAITEIRQSPVYPYRKRVTMMFNPV